MDDSRGILKLPNQTWAERIKENDECLVFKTKFDLLLEAFARFYSFTMNTSLWEFRQFKCVVISVKQTRIINEAIVHLTLT